MSRSSERSKILRSRVAQYLVIGLIAAATYAALGNPPSHFVVIDGNIVNQNPSAGLDWANSGALTTPTPLTNAGTWSRAGSGGIFNGGAFVSTTAVPTAPAFIATDASIIGHEFIVPPLGSEITQCTATQTATGPITAFGTATKNGDLISGETWGAGSVSDKDSLTDAYAISHATGTVNEAFFGAERGSNNGDSHMDYEFLQSPMTTNALPSGCAPGITSGGTFSGHRSMGDLLVSLDFGNGGSSAATSVLQWQCNPGGTEPAQGTICDPANGKPQTYVDITSSINNSATGQANDTGPVGCGGWVCRDSGASPVTQVATNEFTEGGINFADAGFTGCFASMIAHTRASGDINANIPEFIGPFSFSNCVKPAITTNLVSGSHSGSNITVNAGDSVTDTATFTGASGTPTGTVTYTVFSDPSCTNVATTTPATPVTVTVNGSPAPSSPPITFNSPGTFYWQASYSGGGRNLASVSDCGSEVLNVLAAKIGVTKTADAASVSAGTPIGFTVTVTNSGAGTATGVTLTDSLPGGNASTPVHWTIDGTTGNPGAFAINGADGHQVLTLNGQPITMPGGQSLVVHVTATTTSTSCTTYNNTANVTTTNDGNGTSVASEQVLCGSIGVTKTADAASVSAGTPIGFTVTITNTGAGNATGVTLTDLLPAGVTWGINGGANASSFTITGSPGSQSLVLVGQPITMGPHSSLVVHVSAATPPSSCGATYTNTASVNTDNDGNGTSTASEQVLCAAIGVTKTADAPSVSAGQQIGFTVTITNNADGNATGVSLNDPLPGGNVSTPVTWVIDGSVGNPAAFQLMGAAGSQQLTLKNQPNVTVDAHSSLVVHITALTNAQSCATYNNSALVTTANDGRDSSQAQTVVNCPTLVISKTPDASPISSGDPIGFRIEVTNTGTGEAFGVTITDHLPTGPGFNWAVDAGGTIISGCSINGSGVLNCGPIDMNPNTITFVHVTSTTSPIICGSIDNFAFAAATNAPPVSVQATIHVQCPDVSVTKTADASPISAGDKAGFTVTVTNSGLGTAHNVTMTDTLPAGLTWSITSQPGTACNPFNGIVLQCNFGDLGPGTSVAVHVEAITSSSNCGPLVNSATIDAPNQPADDVAHTAQATILVNCASIGVTKTADSVVVVAGHQMGFTITVRNTGAGTATGVTITDTLPNTPGSSWSVTSTGTTATGCAINGGVLRCGPMTLATGATATVHIISPTTGASCGVVDNTAKVFTDNDGSDSSTASLGVLCPNVAVTKTADVSPISAGDPAGFTITVTNTCPGRCIAGPAEGVTLTDVLPPGHTWTIAFETNPVCTINTGTLHCDIGTLANRDVFVVHLTTTATASDCPTISNTVTVGADNEPPSGLADDTASASITVNCPNLQVSKTPGSTPISAGDSAIFTISVTNTGTGVARSVGVSDTLGGGISWHITSQPPHMPCSITGNLLTCNFGDLTSNTMVQVMVSGVTSDQNCGQLMNSASVTGTNIDTGLTAGPATIDVQCPDVTVTKTPDATPIQAGDKAGFTIQVSNDGLGTAIGVTLTDTLPGTFAWTVTPTSQFCSIQGATLSCNFGNMGANTTQTVHIEGTTTANDCGTLHNVVTVGATNEPASAQGNDSASADIQVDCPKPGHLKIEKKAEDNPESRGDPIGFIITVSNDGQGPAHGVTLHDPLPTTLDVSWEIHGSAPGCTITNNTLNCDIGTLDAGDSFSVHVESKTSFSTLCVNLENTASATSDDAGDVSASANIQIKCAHLEIDEHADDVKVEAGDPVGFTIKVTNIGDDGMLNPKMTDPLPTGPGMEWGISSPVSGCSITNNVLSCAMPWLDPNGGSFTVHVTSATNPADCQTLDSTAEGHSTNGGSASASASEFVVCSSIKLTKTADAAKVNAGTVMGFTIRVTNPSSEPANNLVVTDRLPSGNGVAWSIPAAVDGCSISGGTLTCSRSSLAPGAAFTVHVISNTGQASCATYNNTANATMSNGSATSASASLEVSGCTQVLGTNISRTDNNADSVLGLHVGGLHLPVTGIDALRWGLVAAILLAVGAVLTRVSRRRRGRGAHSQ